MTPAEEKCWLIVRAHSRSRMALAALSELNQELKLLSDMSVPNAEHQHNECVSALRRIEAIATGLKDQLDPPEKA